MVVIWGGAKEAARIGFCLGGGARAVVWAVIGSCLEAGLKGFMIGPFLGVWAESPGPGWFLLG